jgi:hypothetical protein
MSAKGLFWTIVFLAAVAAAVYVIVTAPIHPAVYQLK